MAGVGLCLEEFGFHVHKQGSFDARKRLILLE